MINFCKVLDVQTGLIDHHLNPVDISEVRQEPGKVIWLDLIMPDEADFALLLEEFAFHPLALEDCHHAHQRPKLEQYGAYAFLVFYEVMLDAEGCLLTREINCFLGSNYVVTLHRTDVPSLTLASERWESHAVQREDGASYLAYLLVDAAVDSYFPVLDDFSDQLEDLERSIFERFEPSALASVFALKKELLKLRRLVTPLRDVFLVLLRGPHAQLGTATYPYFQDVLDHLLRISDSIDTYRDLVGSSVDAYMSTVSNRTNDVMKKLTVLSTILMTSALIAGIYGMNYQLAPANAWPQGFNFAIGLMAASGLVLAALFRWRRYI